MESVTNGVDGRPDRSSRLQLALTLSEVAIVVWAALLCADFVTSPGRSFIPDTVINRNAAQPVDTDLSFSDLDGLFGRALNNAAPVQTLAESTLDLRIFGTRLNTAGQGVAIVKFGNRQQQVVRVGDTLDDGVRIIGITLDRIDLSRNGRLETVFVDPERKQRFETAAREQGSSSVGASVGATAAASLQNPGQDTQATPKDAGGGDALSQLRAIFDLQPVFGPSSDNSPAAYKVGPNARAAMLDKIGLQINDIILKADNQSLNSFEKGRRLVTRLLDRKAVWLDIERDGERRKLLVELPDLLPGK